MPAGAGWQWKTHTRTCSVHCTSRHMNEELALACWPRRMGMATSNTTTRASTRAAICSGHSRWHTTAPGATAAASTPAKLTWVAARCRGELLHGALSARHCFLCWAICNETPTRAMTLKTETLCRLTRSHRHASVAQLFLSRVTKRCKTCLEHLEARGFTLQRRCMHKQKDNCWHTSTASPARASAAGAPLTSTARTLAAWLPGMTSTRVPTCHTLRSDYVHTFRETLSRWLSDWPAPVCPPNCKPRFVQF